jgi:hypothetical protein
MKGSSTLKVSLEKYRITGYSKGNYEGKNKSFEAERAR